MTERIDVLALFEEGNPMPATSVQEPPVSPGEFLEKVAVRETTEEGAGTDATTVRYWLAAASVIVVIGLAVLLVTWLSPEEPVVTTPQTSTTTSTSTTIASTTTTVSAEEAAWQAIPTWQSSQPGDSGEFRSETFRAPLTFTMSDGWIKLIKVAGSGGIPFPEGMEFPNALRPLVPAADPDLGALFVYRHEEESTDVLVERLMNHPSATNISTGTTTIGGAEATEIRLELTGLLNYIMITPTSFTEMSSGGAAVSRVLEVDGQTVSVVVYSLEAANLPDLEALAQPVIDSIEWRNAG